MEGNSNITNKYPEQQQYPEPPPYPKHQPYPEKNKGQKLPLVIGILFGLYFGIVISPFIMDMILFSSFSNSFHLFH